MGRKIERFAIRAFNDSMSSVTDLDDEVVVEEPLEIRVGGHPVLTTMRNPGADFELVTGWLFTEGLINSANDVHSMRYCGGKLPSVSTVTSLNEDAVPSPTRSEDRRPVAGSNTFNVIDVTPRPRSILDDAERVRTGRHTTMASGACGVCGKSTIEDVLARRRTPPPDPSVTVSPQAVRRIVERLSEHQPTFARTGGTHAAAIASIDGEILIVREDIGRHNALDKAIGWAVQHERLPLGRHVVAVSSRASYELAQKTAMTGAAALIAFSAPSSLAIETAEAANFALIAFAGAKRFNVYAGHDRVVL